MIGGGPAGVTAAAAAAAGGAKVVLVEITDRLGGAVTTAMHRSICGLYASEPKSPFYTLNDSWQRTIVGRMVSHSPDDVKPRQFGKAWVLEFPPAAWAAALDETVTHPNIERRMRTRVASVHREGDHLSAIELGGDQAGTLVAKVFIDCSGGQLLSLAGDDAVQPEDADRMLAGYAVRLAKIGGHLELLRLQIPYALAKSVQAGELQAIARFTVFYPGPGAGEGVCKLAVDLSEMSAIDIERCADCILVVLRRDVPGFAGTVEVERSSNAISREGRRLIGRATLTEHDVLSAHKQKAEVVHAWWPAERWSAADGPTYAYPPVGESYDITGDMLRSATIGNLLAAGNAISATQGAAASSRASGICIATGGLAGQIAATIATNG